jgi:hypothetical protein
VSWGSLEADEDVAGLEEDTTDYCADRVLA